MGLLGGDSSVIGLNIGNSTIKAAELKGKGGRVEVLAVGIVPTPEGSMANGVVVEPQEMAQAVKGLLNQNGFKSRKVVSSVAGQASLAVRIIKVPRMAEKELADAMKWELERYIPFSAAEVIMDYKPIHHSDEDPNSPEMEVLLAVAQEEMINAHVQMLEAAGLKPTAIDVEPLAAARTLLLDGKNGSEGQETIAIINIGSSNTEISVIRSGLLAFTRNVPVAGETLTTSISEQLGLPMDEAERAKKELGKIILPEALPPTQEFQDVGGETGEDLLTESEEHETQTVPVPPRVVDPFALSSGEAFNLDLGASLPSASFSHENPADSSMSAPGSVDNPFDLSLELDSPMTLETPVAHPPRESSPSELDLSDLGFASAPPAEVSAPSPDHSSAAGEASPLDASEQLYPHEQTQPEEEQAPDEGSEALTSEHVYEAMSPGLIELVTETRRSLEYFASQYPNTTIDRVVLMGGTANLKGLDSFLATELEMSVTVSNPFQELHGGVLQGLAKEYLEEIAPVMSVSIGLASRDMVG